MSRKVSDRIEWVVKIMDVQPDDTILEIGCGLGFAIGPVCERLGKGHLTAIDRSRKMVEAAKHSSAEHIASGKVSILVADLLDTDFPLNYFDKIFLFNLNVFWMDPVEELRKIRNLIKPDGKFFIFHQPPPSHDAAEFAMQFQKNLTVNRFTVEGIIYQELSQIKATCVISQPANGNSRF